VGAKVKKPKLGKLQEWEVWRERAKIGGVVSNDLFHVQARTSDQLSSFAVVVPGSANIARSKGVGGDCDIFALTVAGGTFHVTMNIVGKIKYSGDW
jgi:hypothetical protein